MRLNDRVRSKLAPRLAPTDALRAVVLLSHAGAGWASSGGVVHGGGSLFSSAYAAQHGIDFDDPRLRAPLTQSWCAVTDDRLAFFAPSKTSVRPTPADEIDSIALAGTALRWFDSTQLSSTNRVFHFDFADGTRLLSATMYKARLRRRPYNDEHELFVQAFGVAAAEVPPN
ncbi:MAG: hypothetical protein AB8G26_09430 [Ilumatobacter sp.]